MKNNFLLATMIVIGFMVGTTFAIEDYSHYSTGELSTISGTMQHNTFEEREAFRQEWQKRTQDLSSEERAQYRESPGSPVRDRKHRQIRKSRNEGNQNQCSDGSGGRRRGGSGHSNRR